jgi:hypothetical protein
MESLDHEEAVQWLIHLGCTDRLHETLAEKHIKIDGEYLKDIDSIEILQELEDNKNPVRKPVMTRVLRNLQAVCKSGIPLTTLKLIRTKLNNKLSKAGNKMEITD